MPRAAILVGACIAILASAPALAAPATARATAQATIINPAGVRMNWAMAMPSVRGSSSGAAFAGNAPTMSMSTGMVVRNESLTIQREDGGAAAATAPSSFTVTRLDETETMLLRTSASDAFAATGEGVVMGGQLVGGAAASIDVGGRAWLASAQGSQGAPAGQLLVVVVQYN